MIPTGVYYEHRQQRRCKQKQMSAGAVSEIISTKECSDTNANNGHCRLTAPFCISKLLRKDRRDRYGKCNRAFWQSGI